MKGLRHVRALHALVFVLALGIVLAALGKLGLALILLVIVCVGVLAWLFRIDASLEDAARRRGDRGAG